LQRLFDTTSLVAPDAKGNPHYRRPPFPGG